MKSLLCLKNKFPNAVEGAYVSVDYKYASEEPSWTGSVNPVFSENFESQTKDEDINLKGWFSNVQLVNAPGRLN